MDRKPENIRRHTGVGIVSLSVFIAVVIAVPSTVTGQFWPWQRKETKEPVYRDLAVSATWLATHVHEDVMQDSAGKELLVIDTRPAESYRAGHIPTAVNLDLETLGYPLPDQSFLDLMQSKGIDTTRTIISYSDRHCASSAGYLLWLLNACGLYDVKILDGGLDAYTAFGHELEETENRVTETSCRAELDPSVVATKEYVLEHFGEKDIEIVDLRSPEEWGRSERTSDARVGHIPHSLPFDFSTLLKTWGTLRDKEVMRREFSRLGPRPSTFVNMDAEFIIYGLDNFKCFDASGYVLLRTIGIESVRFYPGGWEEWVSDDQTPVVRIITADELLERLSKGEADLSDNEPATDMILLDVRGGMDYKRGHLPGAVSLPSHVFEDSIGVYIEKYWPDADKSTTPFVSYCYGEGCIRSRNTSTMAAQMGFLVVEWFRGGIDDWKAIDAPLLRSD
jgi:thiosulfate/3-mercaptopyruvate sulfurtransferase